jgi:hypothetical protein
MFFEIRKNVQGNHGIRRTNGEIELKLDLWRYMDRQSSPNQVATRFMLNMRILGSPEAPRLARIPGSKVCISTLASDDEIGVQLDKVFAFKSQDHPFAQEETFFCVSRGNLYWFDGTIWHLQESISEFAPDLQDPQLFSYRDILHILGGPEGTSAIFRYLNRDAGQDRGYFENTDGFVGFWYGIDRIPAAGPMNLIGGIYTFPSEYAGHLSRSAQHAVLPVLVDDKGQPGIPDPDSFKTIIFNGDDTANQIRFCSIIVIEIDPTILDKRIVGIDMYGACSSEELVYKSTLQMDIPVMGSIDIPLGVIRKRTPSGDLSFDAMNWKFLRRIDINQPTVMFNTMATASSTTAVKYTAVEGSMGCFKEDVLAGNFWIRYKAIESDDWTYELITSSGWAEEGSPTVPTQTVTVGSAVFTQGLTYLIQIVARWGTFSLGDANAEGWVEIKGAGTPDLVTEKVTIGGEEFTCGYPSVPPLGWSAWVSTFNAAMSLWSVLGRGSFVNPTGYPYWTGTGYRINIRAKVSGSTGNTITLATSDAAKIGISGANLTGGADEVAANTKKAIPVLWRYDGLEENVESELTDPIATVQPYALIEEYYPEARFAIPQDRRIFRLASTTDALHENMLTWSDIDRPSVTPNRNALMFNTQAGERAMGLGGGKQAIIALFERSIHIAQLTGEPVTYDSEEGRLATSCLTKFGVVWKDSDPMWLGKTGIFSLVSGRVEDFTDAVLRDDYQSILASEFSGAGGTYDRIRSFYDIRDELAIWHFPNSTVQIEGTTIKFIAYDLRRGGFLFLDSTYVFTDFFCGYNGVPYGVTETGVHELFASDSTETIDTCWKGVIAASLDEMLIKNLTIAYKGTPTVKIYADRNASASYNRALPTKTSAGKKMDRVMTAGNEIELEISTENSAADLSVEAFETEDSKILNP